MPDFWPDEISREPAFEDIGSHAIPSPYDDVRHLKCPVCHAGPDQKCKNPVTGDTRKIPCIGRKERRE